VGAIVSATLSMLGAALVAPAAVRLLGHRINKWSFGGAGREGSIFSGLVGRVTARPALAAALVVALLLIIASPVGAIEMIPPDPRQLPSGSQGLNDYDAVRAAGLGPTAEVAIKAPEDGRLAPGGARLAAGLRSGQARLNALRTPAQITESQTQAAFSTLQRMTVGKTDPLFAQALQQVGTAVGAATGRNPLTGGSVSPAYPGLAASIGQAADQAGQAANAANQIAAGARQAAAGASRLAAGANQLHTGLVRLEAGTIRLERGLNQLAAGSDQLRRGLARINAGAGQLASGLASGHDQSAPLESGLAQGHDLAALRASQLRNKKGPFKPLRALDQLN